MFMQNVVGKQVYKLPADPAFVNGTILCQPNIQFSSMDRLFNQRLASKTRSPYLVLLRSHHLDQVFELRENIFYRDLFPEIIDAV